MVNRNRRILAVAAVWAASALPAFAQYYPQDSAPPPTYPPQGYRAQDADGGRGYPPAPAYPASAYPAPDRDRGEPYPPQSYPSQPYPGRAERTPADDDRYGYDRGADRQAYTRTETRGGTYAETRSYSVYRASYLTWSGKVEQPDEGYVDERGAAYASQAYGAPGRAGASCPAAAPGERVVSCQYIAFAPPARAEADQGEITGLSVDGGVGPDVIAGGGGGGGGPSNGQTMIGTSFNSGFFGSAFGRGSGSGSGSANASSSASASATASISSSITLSGGFFQHGGGRSGGGGKKGGGSSSCGCESGGGGSGMSGWGGGGGGMSGWSSGGHSGGGRK